MSLDKFGRWTEEVWLKAKHPLSEADARDVLWKMCSDGNLGQAFEFVEQMQSWILDTMRTANEANEHAAWELRRINREWWSGAWIVLLGVTVTERKQLKTNKIDRVRRFNADHT